MSDKPKKPEVKKKCKICRVIFWLLALPLIALAGLYFWITSEPRSLEQFIPQIEESIEDEISGYDVQIGSAYLNWGGFGQFVDVKLSDSSVNDLQNNEIAKIPELELDFKFLPLLMGELQPKNLLIKNSSVQLAGEEMLVKNLSLDFGDNEVDFLSKLSYKNSEIDIYGNAQTGDENNVITIKSDQMNLSDLASINPHLENIGLLLDAEAKIYFESHEPKKIALSVSPISGSIKNDELLRSELQLADGKFLAEYDIIAKELSVQELVANFADGTKISATLKGKAEDNFDLNAEIETVKVENIEKYWPKGVSDNAIEWISESILEGELTNAKANFAMRPWYLDPEGEGFAADALSMSFNFSGLKLQYTDGLAPITNGSGTADMNMTTLNVKVDSANIVDGKNSSDILNTAITIDGIGVLPVETFVAKGQVEGSAANLIAFYERAHKNDAIIRTKNITKGTASTKAEIMFPLDKDLLLADIDIILSSKISNLAASGIAGDAVVKDGNAQIDMDLKGYTLKGSANIEPRIKTDIIETGLTHVAFDISDNNNIEQYKINADLSSTQITIADLGIEKKRGAKASFATVLRKKPKFSDIQSFKFTSAPLSFYGDGSLKKDLSDFTALNFHSLNFKDTELSGKVARADAGYKIYMKGDYFNAAPLLEKAEEAVDDESAPPIYAELDFKKLGFAAGKNLQDVAVSIHCAKGSCNQIDLKSDLLEVKKSSESLEVTSKNFGDILKAFDVYDHLHGGEMRLKADISDEKYNGNLNVKKFKIKESKFLLNLLTLGSLTGIADILNGEGISFDKLSGNFEYEPDKMVVLRDTRMKGNSIGATVEGIIDLDTESLKLDGKIIPAYSANTILGKIPVLGDLLIGDDGIFAFAYKIGGTIEEPKQEVNPLSVLAPGVLQKIFE